MPTIRVSTAYGITKPGEVPYSSENFRVAFEVEDDMTQEAAMELLAKLEQDAKIAVITQARLNAGTDENGVVFPVFGGQVTEQASNVVPITAAASAPQDGGTVPNVDTRAQQMAGDPVAAPVQQSTTAPSGAKDMTWDGRPVVVYDNRPKKADGSYKPNAADFRLKFKDVGEEAPDDVKFKPVWIKNQNGSVNQAGVALANAFDAS
jgi:hypothetical protein